MEIPNPKHQINSGSSPNRVGKKGTQIPLPHRPGGASRPGQDSIGGKTPDGRTIAWLPQGTCPRPLSGQPNRISNRANRNIFRREPMKDPPPYDVLPRAGWAPWAPTKCPPPWQRGSRPMENHPKSPTRMGDDPFYSYFVQLPFLPAGDIPVTHTSA